MLSRRNVRIKVMQQLYSLIQDKELTFRDIKIAYNKSIEDTFRLYLLNLYSISKVCSFSTEDLALRQKKHLKTEDDLKFTNKLYRIRPIRARSRRFDTRRPHKRRALFRFFRAYRGTLCASIEQCADLLSITCTSASNGGYIQYTPGR